MLCTDTVLYHVTDYCTNSIELCAALIHTVMLRILLTIIYTCIFHFHNFVLVFFEHTRMSNN